MASFNKTFYFNFRRDHQKNFYERGDYESVDEKSLSYAMSRETTKETIQAVNGLNEVY